MSKCPCCSKLNYEACCGLYHDGRLIPKTFEALMRSRYSAYTMANMDYIKKTMQGTPLENFNELDAKTWSQNAKWLKLKIVNVHNVSSEQGHVEYIASFVENGQHRSIHEISEFQLINGQWFYVNGTDVIEK